VKFEDALSISVLKNRASRYKNLRLEIEQFLKMSNVLNIRPPTISNPAFFKVCNRSTSACQSFQDDWNRLKRVKPWRWFQVGFIGE
jgi:hypothetical protein